MNDPIENFILRLYFLLPKLLITLEADDVEDKFESEWWWWWLLLWWVPNVRPMAFITFYYFSHYKIWGIFLFLYLFGTKESFSRLISLQRFTTAWSCGSTIMIWLLQDWQLLLHSYMHKCDYFRNEENCLAIKHSR